MSAQTIDRRPPPSIAGIAIPWGPGPDRPTDSRIEETTGLAEALGCEIGFVTTERVRQASPSHFLSGGVLDRLKTQLEDIEASLFILDGALTPVQQRNLERRLNVKVVDRTGLILEIFGLRARTKAGQLQVELARQLYERSRLVRTWTHLERQRGGRGFLSGPGETQLEADKRMLDTKIRRLREDLDTVQRTRLQQRQGRKRADLPTVALVGYTNAGKSTLFNRLTNAGVLAKDMPFATLDPTIRKCRLPDFGDIALVDTVGFISDLPTHLVESFQATLEEAIDADLLVHVRDRSSPVDATQKSDVEAVLNDLSERLDQDLPPILEVWNKADLLPDDHRERLIDRLGHVADEKAVLVSSLTGEGVPDFLQVLKRELQKRAVDASFEIAATNGAARAWLYEHGDVLSERQDGEAQTTCLKVRLNAARLGQFQASFPDVPSLIRPT